MPRFLINTLRSLVFFHLASGGLAGSLPQPPPDWTLEVVAQAPAIRHPSVVCCAPDGRVFVAEDPMDISLPKADTAAGRMLCLHPDSRITVFAEKLHAVFGMQYLEGKIYVVHSPKFSVFTDDNGVGRDRVDLIESLNPNPWALDWNDHVPANFRLGMDGYFYLAVGDKGVYGAVGRDGKRVDLHGGGILRLRPDGTELEVYCTGVRNILDVAINAEDEIFTYDNTDEQQWMSRLTHMADGGFYGYPYDFIPRRPYTLWCLADYGGGAATGALCYNEDALPAEYHGNLFLADFGKRQLLRLQIRRERATYTVLSREDLFIDPPEDFRPVGICLSSDGMTIYICDWNHRDTKENVAVGRLWKLIYKGKNQAGPRPEWYLPAAMGRKVDASTEELLKGLSHPAQSVRLVAQRRLVERGRSEVPSRRREEAPNSKSEIQTTKSEKNQSPITSAAATQLNALLHDSQAAAYARWHALWALDGIDRGESVRKAIVAAASDADAGVRRQAIRQLGTRRVREASQLLISKLTDADASVRFQAATALGRIGEPAAVPPLIVALDEEDLFVRYAVFTALNRIGRADRRSWEAILTGLESDKPRVREGTSFALRQTYNAPLAGALRDIALDGTKRQEARIEAIRLLAGIHRKASEWKGEWWAYHPVNSPRPSNTESWDGTPIVLQALQHALVAGDRALRIAGLKAISIEKVTDAAGTVRALLRETTDRDVRQEAIRSIGVLKDKDSGDLVSKALLDKQQPAGIVEEAIHAAAEIGGPEVFRALVEFLKRGKTSDLFIRLAIEALAGMKAREAGDAVEPYTHHASGDIRRAALNALVKLDSALGESAVQRLVSDTDLEVRRSAIVSAGKLKCRELTPRLVALAADPGTRFEAVEALAQMPETAALELFLEGLASKNSDLRAACRKAIGALGREALPVIETRAAGLSPAVLGELQRIFTKDDRARRGPLFTTQVKVLEATDYFDFALKESGDAGRGREIFADASGVACVRCHRAGQDGGDTGPDLSGIGAQFDKRALAESILFPSKAVREGYQQVEIETNDNETVYGLVRTEDNESLVIRDASGAARQIAKTEIKSRRNSELSLMPEGLQAGLSLQEFADLVEYLASLKGRQ